MFHFSARKVFLVTSVIDPGPAPLVGDTARSIYGTQGRLFQTAASLHAIHLQQPDADVILCDASILSFESELRVVCPRLNYLHLASLNPTAADFVRSVRNKSAGECALLQAAWDHYRQLICNANFLVKLSGRYLPENLTEVFFNYSLFRNSYLFCPVLPTDIRTWVQADSGLSWELAQHRDYKLPARMVLCTILYGMGHSRIEEFFSTHIPTIAADLQKPEYYYYDIENLLTRQLTPNLFDSSLVRTDWRYVGWAGVSGYPVRT
jgi:hypothetical protein